MKYLVTILAIVGLMSCGTDNSSSPAEKPATKLEPSTPVQKATSDTVDVVIKVGDEMKFSENRIIVEQGDVVRLKLEHTGTMPKTSMGHNWVLLKNGVNVSDFGMAAASAKDNDYIPANMQQDVIAHTKIIGGGESDEIIFQAPEEGAYEYICSFPGHYGMMKGKLVVM